MVFGFINRVGSMTAMEYKTIIITSCTRIDSILSNSFHSPVIIKYLKKEDSLSLPKMEGN